MTEDEHYAMNESIEMAYIDGRDSIERDRKERMRFDANDPRNLGRPRYFDVDAWLDVVEMYICADEVEKALRLLDDAPAYYRDHVPERAKEIRRSLNRQLYTPIQYKGIYDPTQEIDPDRAWSHRFQAAERAVRELGACPHIMELAPGEFILPKGLRKHGLEFTYEHMGVDDTSIAIVSEPKPGAKTLFAAFELIEHLSDPWDIYRNYLKLNREADVIMISTPLYTYAAVSRDWRTSALGHLRCYSPASLHACVSQMFEGYEWTCETSDVIVLTGRK